MNQLTLFMAQVPVPDSVVNTFLQAWGPAGAVVATLLFAVYWLASNLLDSWRERMKEQREMLDKKFAADQEMAGVMRDLKSSIDASTKMIDLALQQLRKS